MLGAPRPSDSTDDDALETVDTLDAESFEQPIEDDNPDETLKEIEDENPEGFL